MPKSIVLLNDFSKLFQFALLINLLVSLFLFLTINDNDFSNLPPKEKPMDRYISLLFFNTSLFSTCGYGNIMPISNRIMVFTTIYSTMITVGILSLMFNLFLQRASTL
jgi:hypothetical protein